MTPLCCCYTDVAVVARCVIADVVAVVVVGIVVVVAVIVATIVIGIPVATANAVVGAVVVVFVFAVSVGAFLEKVPKSGLLTPPRSCGRGRGGSFSCCSLEGLSQSADFGIRRLFFFEKLFARIALVAGIDIGVFQRAAVEGRDEKIISKALLSLLLLSLLLSLLVAGGGGSGTAIVAVGSGGI